MAVISVGGMVVGVAGLLVDLAARVVLGLPGIPARSSCGVEEVGSLFLVQNSRTPGPVRRPDTAV